MTYQTIEVETKSDVGIIRLNDPSTLNAVSLQMVEELAAAFTEFDQSARAIILTGVGRAFCSGANLSGGLSGAEVAGEEPDFGKVLESHINPLMDQLRNLSVPWVSAVRGAAAGVGCALALAADLVVAGGGAYFLQAFSRIGLVPDGGSSHLLIRAIGRVRAMEMMLLADRVPAAQALSWGLINRLVPDAAVESSALDLAKRLAAGPTKTLGMVRKLAWTVLDADWPEALHTERSFQLIAGRTEDANEGIAAFMQKRAAKFVGH